MSRTSVRRIPLRTISTLALLAGLFAAAACQVPTAPGDKTELRVVYDANGGDGAVPTDPNAYEAGQMVTVKGNAGLTKPGQQFGGWGTSADGSGPSYAEGDTFAMNQGDVRLYAQWGSTLVVYHADEATGGAPPTTRVFPVGAEVAVQAGTLSRNGHLLAGWNTRADRLGESYASGATFVMGEADIDLYPVWIPEQFQFSADGTEITLIGGEIAGVLEVPAGVTAVGDADALFSGLAITGLVLPATVTSIGPFAFAATLLTEVTLPAGIVTVGTGAFAYCSELTEFTVDAANPSFQAVGGLLYDKTGTQLIQAPGALQGAFTVPGNVTSLGAQAFAGSKVTSVTLPASVVSLGEDAFTQCAQLATVTMLVPIEVIPDSLFYEAGLTSITLPASVRSIGADAFYRTKLTSITVPAGVTAIGFAAFESNTQLTSATLPEGLTTISGQAFQSCSQLGAVTIPSTVTFIGPSAFLGCSSLTSVALPAGLTRLGDFAFRRTGLTSVTVPAVAQIGRGVFKDNGQLTSVTLASGSTVVGAEMFAECDLLAAVSLPDSVLIIGADAFWECVALTAITLPSGLTAIGEGAFGTCLGLTAIVIPDSVTFVGPSAFADCWALTTATLPAPMQAVPAALFDSCKKLAAVTLPAELKTIGQAAFRGTFALKTITLPQGLQNIREEAFSHSGITAVTIPASILLIERFAFLGGSLVSVTMQSVVPPRLGSGGQAFPKTWENTVYRIFVPAAGLNAYKTDTVFWNPYREIILAS